MMSCDVRTHEQAATAEYEAAEDEKRKGREEHKADSRKTGGVENEREGKSTIQSPCSFSFPAKRCIFERR
jgi:hypothetical protein